MIGPIPLGNANSTTANPTNSWPRWNPFVVHESSGDLMYFTFSSTRDYGIELGRHAPDMRRRCGWRRSIRPRRRRESTRSAAAFWMPYQDVKSHNHIAQWTATFIP